MRELTPAERAACLADPVAYCHYFLDEFVSVEAVLDPSLPVEEVTAPIQQQRQVLRAVARHPMVSVAGSNLFGKSHMLVRLASWWLDCHRECFIVVMAPRFDQIQKNFTVPFTRLRATVEVSTGKSNSRCFMPDPTFPLRQVFCTTARTPENIAGWHYFKNRLFILDEASGIPTEIWDAIRPMLGRADSKIVVCGNPLRNEEEERFIRFKETSQKPSWVFFSLSAWDHPNVVHQRPLIKRSMSPTWPQEMLEEYGPDSPTYIARVEGRFAQQTSESLYALFLDAVMPLPSHEPFRRATGGYSVLGIDPAGALSGDKTAFCRWDGSTANGQTAEILYTSETATDEAIVARVQQAFADEGIEAVGIDTNGIGYHLPGILQREGIPAERIFRYVGHRKARDKRRFLSQYHEDAFSLRDRMEQSVHHPEPATRFRIGYNHALRLQLASRRFGTKQGRLALRDKYVLQKSSPDEFDALLVAQDAYTRYIAQVDRRAPTPSVEPSPTEAWTPFSMPSDAFVPISSERIEYVV